jgi:peptidoglycan hydrolase CwlO-like protein
MDLSLNRQELIDLETFCLANGLGILEFTKKCYIIGFNIERYGLLNQEKVIEVTDPEELKNLENKIMDLEKKLDDCNNKRKMLEETNFNLKKEISNFKNN